MTAEIAIFNKTAVALAADSAVTIGEGGQKIYNSANKLFTLSKYAPVGIMVYGNSSIMNVPWETVIKIYRKGLGKKTFPSISAYAKDFLKFLTSSKDLFPPELQQQHYQETLLRIFQVIVGSINKKVQDRINSNGRITDAEVSEIVAEEMKSTSAQADALNDIPGATAADAESTFTAYKKIIEATIGAAFQQLPLDAKGIDALLKVARCLVTKDYFLQSSGVVFAGFGETEIFPVCETYWIEGIWNGKLKVALVPGQSNSISHEQRSLVIMFAQQEMAHTFLRGMEPKLFDAISDFVKTHLAKYPEVVGGKIPDEDLRKKIVQELLSEGAALHADFYKRVEDYRQEFHTGPILNAVEVLAKDDLAAMAESLVNLTSFKRKVTLGEKETVGGPIDVAVISKGDGFIWIKRKHYFPPELNQHFFRNYFEN